MGLSRWNNGEIFRNKTKCQHLPGNRSQNSHGNFRDEFDGTHGIQLVAIEIFSCLVRNFFFVKICDDTFVLFEALHRTESELLRSGPSQRTGRSAYAFSCCLRGAAKRSAEIRRPKWRWTSVRFHESFINFFPVNVSGERQFICKWR